MMTDTAIPCHCFVSTYGQAINEERVGGVSRGKLKLHGFMS